MDSVLEVGVTSGAARQGDGRGLLLLWQYSPQLSMEDNMLQVARSLIATFLLLFAVDASAQTLPVSVNVSGNVATVRVGALGNPIADVTLSFDDATGLSAASLGISA